MANTDDGIRRRLFLARESARFTQQEAAAAAGMSRQKLSRCEKGDSSPSLEEFRELCILYGVTPSFIMFGIMTTPPELARLMRPRLQAESEPDPV